MRWYLYITTALILFLSQGVLWAEEMTMIAGESDRISYSLGYQIGNDFKSQGLDLDAKALVRGFNDASAGAEPKLARKQMNAILSELKARISATQRGDSRERRARKNKQAQEKRSKGRAFMDENAKKPGVETLPSGLQYRVIRAGNGSKPGPGDSVRVHYRGRMLNGQEFDSSYRRNSPATFRVDGVIAGWTEALQLMKEGAKWELYIPPDLAYGRREPLADETLIFEVELLGVGEDGKAAESKQASD
jgi:FKBP-type peptidyl-prolyl cis-trans isomerase FklB